jgi:hypothetical protein
MYISQWIYNQNVTTEYCIGVAIGCLDPTSHVLNRHLCFQSDIQEKTPLVAYIQSSKLT